MSLNIQPMVWSGAQAQGGAQDDAVGNDTGGHSPGGKKTAIGASAAPERKISQPMMFSGAMPGMPAAQDAQGGAAQGAKTAGQNPMLAVFQKFVAFVQQFFSSLFGGGAAKPAEGAEQSGPPTPGEDAGGGAASAEGAPQDTAGVAVAMGTGTTGPDEKQQLQALRQQVRQQTQEEVQQRIQDAAQVFQAEAKGLQGQAGAPSASLPGPGKTGSWSAAFVFVGFAVSQNSGKAPAEDPAGPSSSSGSSGWSATAAVGGKSEIKLGSKYTMKFNESRSEMTLVNNQTGHQTRIWGDPHLDLSGNKGDGVMFKNTMTFKLPDNTKITVQTKPAGNSGRTYADKVTVTNGDEAYVVKGLSQDRRGDFSVEHRTDGKALDAAVADGYVMAERADGKGFVSEQLGRKPTQADLNAAHA